MDYYNSSLTREEGRNCVLSTNAQQFRQKIQSMGAVDLTDKNFWTTKNEHFLHVAVYYEIYIYPADLDYINNKICADELFDLIFPQINSDDPNKMLNVMEFYNKFFSDPQMPSGTRKILATNEANCKGLRKPGTKQILKYRQPYIELWFEKVNLTRQ